MMRGRELWKDLYGIRVSVVLQQQRRQSGSNRDSVSHHHHHYHYSNHRHNHHQHHHDHAGVPGGEGGQDPGTLLQQHPAAQHLLRSNGEPHHHYYYHRHQHETRAMRCLRAATSDDDDDEEESSPARAIAEAAAHTTSTRALSPVNNSMATRAGNGRGGGGASLPAHPLNTIEVLPPDEEAEAILYDNHDYDVSEQQPCVGYFGFHPLLSVATNNNNSDAAAANPMATTTYTNNNDNNNNTARRRSTTPIAIWGDFRGLRVAPSWDALLNPSSRDRDRLLSIHDENQSQVMDFLAIPPEYLVAAATAAAGGGVDFSTTTTATSPFFLAFASGVVMAVTARDDEFQILSSSATHAGEVTCLTLVPPFSNHHPGYLMSACVHGRVYLYPDSLTKLSLERKICINPDEGPGFPIFDITATAFGPDHVVLVMGGQGLKLSLWELKFSNGTQQQHQQKSGDFLQVVGQHQFEYEPHITNVNHDDGDLDDEPNDANEEGQVDHVITKVSFVGPVLSGSSSLQHHHPCPNHKKDVLVVGTSRGHILTWELMGHAEDPHRPHLQLYTSQERTHCGSVESTERVGDILLTTGGKDGVIKAMDLASGLPLATLLVHPGRLLAAPTPAPPVRLKCAVVKSWVCHERQSIIGLCRDGHISEWSFQIQSLPTTSSAGSAAAKGIGHGIAFGGSTGTTKSKRAASGVAPKAGKRPRLSTRQTTNSHASITSSEPFLLFSASSTRPSIGISALFQPKDDMETPINKCEMGKMSSGNGNKTTAASSSASAAECADPSTTTTSNKKDKKASGNSNKTMEASSSASATESLDSSTTTTSSKKMTSGREQLLDHDEIPALLESFPETAKGFFYQLGFSKWGKLQRPVLILSPLSVPKGPIREAWLKSVQAFFKRLKQQHAKSNSSSTTSSALPPLLIHWLGAQDPKKAYSMIPVSKFTPLGEGMEKNFHQMPKQIQQRVDKGEKLSSGQQECFDGLSLLPKEAEKEPCQRSHLLEHFIKDDQARKVQG